MLIAKPADVELYERTFRELVETAFSAGVVLTSEVQHDPGAPALGVYTMRCEARSMQFAGVCGLGRDSECLYPNSCGTARGCVCEDGIPF